MKIGYLMQLGEEIRYPPYNGPANHVRQVFQELVKRGHRIKILFRLDGKLWKSEDLQQFTVVPVPQVDQGLQRWIERFVRKIQSLLKLPYIGYFESRRFAIACRHELAGYDILYERWTWMTYGGALASRWLRIPWVLEYNGDPLADLEAKKIAPKGIQRWLSVRIMGWAIAQASKVVATGEGWRESTERDWGVPYEKSTIIENGTDLLELIPREEIQAFRIVAREEPHTQLVYLGGFYRWHGVDILLRAMARLVSEGLNLHLVLIGSGDGMEEAQSLARELKLNDVVKFLGRLSAAEYAPILASADIGLSPYCGWQEFSGLKIFDYKAAGLACIASGKDGQPATLEHGETGWIVPPCDEGALAEAIKTLALDRKYRQAIGRAARLEAERVHSWAHTAQKVEFILEKCISQ